ncbi:MAG TPA: prolyl oligopeptidase family serine peptidase [Chitinophagaceae bacterium]|nr:prolyl oligopeptidase family serine peptidase [Chitinophagaceae bacterium]
MGKLLLCYLLAALFISSPASAQSKKNLTPEDYRKWQTLGVTDLSPNGEWVAHQVTVQEDNDTLYVTNRNHNKVYKLEFASAPEFSRDNKWIAYRIGIPFKEAEKLRETSKPIEYKMGLLNLITGKKEEVKNINRFSFSRNGKFLAVYLTPPKENKDKGAVLLVKNLADGTTRTIGNVTEYAFNKKSDYISYIVESANTAGNSIELFHLNSGKLKVLASDTARFSKVTWQKEGDGVAFFKAYRKDRYEEDNAVVYTYINLYKAPTLKIFDPETRTDFPKDQRIFTGSNLALSDDMSAAFFGLKPWTYNELAKKEDRRPGDSLTKADTARIDSTRTIIAAKKGTSAEKLAGVEVWHWKDPEIQPRQKITLAQDTILSALSVWNIDNNRFFQLTTEEAPLAQLSGNQKYAVVFTNKKYKPAFKEDFADAHLVNIRTGERKLAFEKVLTGFNTFPSSSPDGRYLLYFKDKHWWTYNMATGANTNLTSNIKSDFWDVRDDHPASRPAVGSGGWLKGDKQVLLYDEYDVWSVQPDGKGARKLTNGKDAEVRYRLTRTDFEERYIDDSQPLHFSMYGDKTKKYGYAKFEKGKVEPLVFEDMLINRLVKAKDANSFLFVKQDYDKSPTLYATNNFSDIKQIATTNLQQADYYWGKSQLISYINKDGKTLQGALFYPANYEPGKKYPMITYIYEELSSTVHGYTAPNQRGAYNTTNFTTNGYFVFRPDIVYKTNDPGISAVDCVVPAVEEVLKTGMIDKDKLGLMGHSWGAYQTSFIITQTPMFKAAIAGAPLTNLISMSNSIYWNTGTPDAKIFETSQGRFDGPWYERMEAHMRNSPMYQAANIKTPLLVAFGDKDGAVDWHQGIEMYSTMRRMQKPHIMLVYADENHGLAKKENQVDYQKRQKEYFDHYLLGKPAERWITEGMSQQEKAKQTTATPAGVRSF